MRLKSSVNLLICIVSFEIIGFALGMLTQANLVPWYETIRKSALTPPGPTFSIVWSILYALLAVVGWYLWQNRQAAEYKTIFNLYSIQLLMNWAWTPLFFQLHWLGFSFFWIVLMVGINTAIIITLQTKAKAIAWTLIPYLLWLIFAAYLNGVIWVLN